MPRKPDAPCSNCGTLGWRIRNKGQTTPYTCRPCRRLGFGEYVRAAPYKYGTKTGIKTPCVDCAEPSRGTRCRKCANRAQRFRPDDDYRVRRADRERSAPGLTPTQRNNLRLKWRDWRRPCFYCPALATVLDHVVPLVRGGTNHEGNLVPCCQRCNSSKFWVAGSRVETRPEARDCDPCWHYLVNQAGPQGEATSMGRPHALHVVPHLSGAAH